MKRISWCPEILKDMDFDSIPIKSMDVSDKKAPKKIREN